MKKFFQQCLFALVLLVASCQNDDDEPTPTSTPETSSSSSSISLNSIDNITYTGALVNVSVSKSNQENAVWGVCWSENNTTPTIQDASQEKGNVTSSTQGQVQVSNLESGKTYHLRAYLTEGTETYYSEAKTFSTLSGLPVISAPQVSQVGYDYVLFSCDVLSIGSSPIINYGICWSKTNPEPTIRDRKEIRTNTIEASSFFEIDTEETEKLESGTEYYFRAFAENETGIYYSDVVVERTRAYEAPKLSSISLLYVTNDDMYLEGILANFGSNPIGQSLQSAGFCWSETNPEPTIADEKYESGELFMRGTGENQVFDFYLRNFKPNTKYYIRAFGQNDWGYGYSEVIEITTKPENEYLTSATKRTEWWNGLSIEWKKEFNASYFFKGAVEDTPSDSDLLRLLQANSIVFNAPSVSDLSGLEKLEYLSELAFLNAGLTDLEGFEKITNLAIFGFAGNKVTSLKPLSNLKSLISINAKDNQLTSLEGLEELTNLRTLKIKDGNNIPENEIQRIEDLLGITIE